jgi:hypothetical protein
MCHEHAVFHSHRVNHDSVADLEVLGRYGLTALRKLRVRRDHNFNARLRGHLNGDGTLRDLGDRSHDVLFISVSECQASKQRDTKQIQPYGKS